MPKPKDFMSCDELIIINEEALTEAFVPNKESANPSDANVILDADAVSICLNRS